MIVVAIISTNRFRDFSQPTSDIANPNLSDTGSEARFSAFLKNELMPYMNKNYRTETYNIFIGHSLGGIIYYLYTRHNSIPLRSVYDGLELLFSRWVYLGEDDAGKLEQYYKSLSEEFGFECKPAEDAVASIGRKLIRKENFSEVIKVYQYYVKNIQILLMRMKVVVRHI